MNETNSTMAMHASPILSGLLYLAILLPSAIWAQDPPPIEELPYEVGMAVPPIDEGREMLPMTLDEAIAMALQSNLNIQSQRLNPEIQLHALEAARSAFNPTFNFNTGYENATSMSTSQLDGGNRTTTERHTFSMSLNQPAPWYGGQFNVNFNNNRTGTDNIFATRNPSYSSIASVNFTQPLLSGRRIDNQRNNLRTQEVQQEVAHLQLRTQVENLSHEVRGSYWTLRALIEQIEIQRRSLAQAEQLLENNRIQVELGTMVELDLAQAEAQVAAAEQALLNAEIQWRNQELALKSLLVGGSDDPLFLRTINPVDLPEYDTMEVDIEAAIERAIANRPDLEVQRQQRAISNMNLEVTHENTRPTLNLVLSYSLQGIGGTLFDRAELGGEPQLIERGGYLDGLSSLANFDTPTFNASLNFSYPIGRSAADANLDQARLQLRQSELQLQAQQLQVETEVTSAGLAVRNASLQMEAARRTREAAERSAEAEMTRFSVGVSTNFQVVTAQDNLTQARLSELQATFNYISAIAEFERVQGITW